MNFNRTDDQRMLADTLARYLKDQYSHEHRHQSSTASGGYSKQTYSSLCELGIAGALLPESCGGYGGSGTDITTVFEELGKALVVEPFLSSVVLSGTLLCDVSPHGQAELINDIIHGNKTVALAHYEPGNRYDANKIQCKAIRSNGNWTISGQKNQIYNAATASFFIVSAMTQSGVSLFLIDREQRGITISSHGTIDGYQSGDLQLDNIKIPDSALLGDEGSTANAIEKAIARGVLAVCAEALGAMTVCKEMTIEYLQTRKQFGVELGRFQVLQHRMVDVLIELEQARSAVMNAAAYLEQDRLTRETSISAAKTLIGRTNKLIAEESIQMHGGIAMTWEYPLSHYAKRLIMIDHILGDSDYHLQRFIDISGLKRDNVTIT